MKTTMIEKKVNKNFFVCINQPLFASHKAKIATAKSLDGFFYISNERLG